MRVHLLFTREIIYEIVSQISFIYSRKSLAKKKIIFFQHGFHWQTVDTQTNAHTLGVNRLFVSDTRILCNRIGSESDDEL